MATINSVGVGLQGISGANSFVGRDSTQTVTANYFTAGTNAGVSGGGSFTAFPPTASNGSLAIVAADSSGNFIGTLSNASLTTSQDWNLPDESGTIALNGSESSGYVLLDANNTQTILGPYSLTMDQGSYYATAGSYFAPAGAYFSGNGSSDSSAGTFIAYAPGGNLGSLVLTAANSSANYEGDLTNLSLTGDRTWSLPDATGTIALTSSLPLTWGLDSGTTITAAVATGYILTDAGAVTVNLPTTFAAGAQIGVAGGVAGNSWTISIPGGTSVSAYGTAYTTSIESTNYSDTIVLIATADNTSWTLLDTSSVALNFI
jgi:hypothetical protein